MTTEVSTLSSGNFAEMAKAMGMTTDMSSGSSKQSTLPRLRIWNSPVMGQVEVKGKMKNMEVIEGGMYRLQLPDDTYIYSPTVRIRPFVQRFMYKKYESGTKTYVKTLMSDNINLDLKDTAGTLNCGRPSGYIADYKALPKETQDLMKSIKRVRVIFGEVEMLEPVNAQGESIEPVTHPFIWEIDNKDAYKDMGIPFATLGRQKRLPIQHWINLQTQSHDLPTGAVYYTPIVELDQSTSIDLQEEDQVKFSSFLEWINNYNDYVLNQWNEKRVEKISEDDMALVEDFIDVDMGDDQ